MSLPAENEAHWGWSEIKRELDALGFRPTKSRGQNFLTDPNLARALVQDSGVGPGDRVLEVGPGCGFLTVPLAERGVELLAVEIDSRLASLASRRVGERPNVRFLVTDVLASKRQLAKCVVDALWPGKPWHVVANLPYSITGPLIATLAAFENPPKSMSLVVQREVAERLAAKAGEEAWGGLSAKVQLVYQVRLGRRVGRELFHPRPNVESSVVCLEHTGEFEVTRTEAAEFVEWTDRLFTQRRKALRKSLGVALGDPHLALQVLREAGIDPLARPESLDVAGLLGLVRVIRAHSTP